MMLVIWGKQQQQRGATDWHDGQFSRGGCAFGAHIWRRSIFGTRLRPTANAIIKCTVSATLNWSESTTARQSEKLVVPLG
jgi:hypothetical protein